MASQQREPRTRGQRILNEDQILDELARSEGDFSASDDDDLYEPPEVRRSSNSDGYNSSDSEESIDVDDEVLSTPPPSSPALSSSSLIRGHREPRVKRGQSSRRNARGGGRLIRVRGRGRIVQGNNQTSNTWTGGFSPTIHNLLSPNYIQRNFGNFEMFQYFEDYIDDNILEKIVTTTNQTEMMKTQKNLGLTLRELKIFFGISMVMATIGYPKIKMYREKAWRLPIVTDNMTRDRFFLLRTRLKVVFDNDVPDSQRAIDKIWKVRPLFDCICEGCHIQQKSEHLAIDEMIIPFSVGCEVYSTTSLLQFLRNTLDYRGTKYMCLEGGCGACIVSVSKCPGEPIQSINSCLVSITSCHGWDITTIEKVGNRKNGYHPLQTTLAEQHGTQCGYCTPGWIMAMYSLLKKNGKMKMSEIEQSFGSNVCRCTGYRPILEAFKKFAKDAPHSKDIPDIEDLTICKKTGKTCKKDECDESDWCHVTKEDFSESSILYLKLKDNRHWFKVEELVDIFNVLRLNGDDSYMLVDGNTAKGVNPIDEYPRVLIDISGISVLKRYFIDQNLVIGAGMTISNLVDVFDEISKREYFRYLKVLNNHLKNVAHIPVRNLGTIAGNLMIKHQKNEFASDLFLLFETVGAVVTVLYQNGARNNLRMLEFLQEDMRAKVLLQILLPPFSDEVKIVTDKVIARSQNAQTIVNAGFLYQISKDGTVLLSRIVYGGLSPNFNRAINTERCLFQKKLFTNETLAHAVNILRNELIVVDQLPLTSARYRKFLAISLFYKGLLSLCPLDVLGSRYRSGAINLHRSRPVSQARQIFDTNPALWPLNQPIQKVEALVQSAGEAPFSEDVPTLSREVYAAFALSTVALGTIEHVDATKVLNTPGVIDFYTAKDIPGINSFTPGGSQETAANEEILCNGEVKYFHQPIGIVVAETQAIAERASKLLVVKYSNIRKPVIDVKVAKDDTKRTTLFMEIKATETGTDVQKVIKGNVSVYGQYHFCMETLVCVSYPTEEGMRVHTSTQWLNAIQLMTSRALNMPQNKIDVVVRRAGGAYGYKITRSTQVAVSCNLVVQKLNRPCRFIQSLKTNMRAVGKRLPCFANYEIAVNKDGAIQYVNYNLYEDNGYVISEPLILFALDVYYNCYNNVRWNFKAFNTTTDTASNTWCRSPGTLEAILMAEYMMEQISYELSLDPIQVRLANLNTTEHIAVQEMLEKLKVDGDYDNRRAAVDKYNRENRWKKRGIRFSCMRWTPVAIPLYLDVNLAVYSGDGTIAITHSGVEMGQGINTKAVQICAYMLKISIEKVQIKANDTTISPNQMISGASITSQNIGIGVQRCCEELLKRLEPIRQTMDNPTWEELIAKAFQSGVDLQTHGFVSIADSQKYTVYGVALAEVEIDVLTGESEIIRVDLAEDVGRSVSPEIDIGQIEGAFMMGLGYMLSEKLVYNPDTGELLTNNTLQYSVPQAKDIPQDFRIYFRKGSFSNNVLLGSKATGEPATCLAVVVPIAIREAIVSARSECGIPSTEWFNIDGPHTVERICLATATKLEEFKFY